MPFLIGAATAATTLLSMALGQIDAGFAACGVLLAAVVLMNPARGMIRSCTPRHSVAGYPIPPDWHKKAPLRSRQCRVYEVT